MGANGLDTFPVRFVLATINEDISLPCGTTSKGDEVTWKFKDEEMKDLDKNNHNLLVDGVGDPSLGEYTCWRGGESASTHLLLIAEKKLDSFLSCRAKSYNCKFSCTWNNSNYHLVRLGLGPHCRKGNNSCNWFNGTVDKQDGSLHFELFHSLSPYAEESNMLELTAEATDGYYFSKSTMRFYLRDIIQPDSPQIIQWQELAHNLNVIVNPPRSWSKPHSFFTLEHEVQYQSIHDGKVQNSSNGTSPFQIPKAITKLRVRSRDLLVKSAWSQWSAWVNVITPVMD
nr:interleukin-12 subunit beta-like [Nerophis lumbriciformis]